ncbi:hypothetical protein O7606_02305 [Micromonospora sp. WMMD882]|uniref:hypothetical protein n=1 Tax=Micromonospora sp. WMMD882 TaxID=3015151 RepID=UPI00248AE5DA|nr:hypothetical protein [Micromonospora sp. WMMD882]WBB80239.1 hypothetical protein O7606_02305 [Micromonospora sp. WMMD882]
MTARVDAILGTFRSSRAVAAERFGPLSKASYLVTFATLTALFHVHLECLDSAERGWVAGRLDDVREELYAMFRRMTQPPRAEVRRTPGRFAGIACDLLTFDGERAEARAGREALRGRVVGLDDVLRSGTSPGTYLFCLTEQDELVLYAVPLSYGDMMTGAVAGEFTVKHTMLPEEGVAVVCAGEIHVAVSPAGAPGVIVTRASGHFQPRASAELLTRDHLVRRYGMRGDAVCLLSHPGAVR